MGGLISETSVTKHNSIQFFTRAILDLSNPSQNEATEVRRKQNIELLQKHPSVALATCLNFQSYDQTREWEKYLLVYACSRTIGSFTQIVWDRALGMSLENPKSINMPWIEEFYQDKERK